MATIYLKSEHNLQVDQTTGLLFPNIPDTGPMMQVDPDDEDGLMLTLRTTPKPDGTFDEIAKATYKILQSTKREGKLMLLITWFSREKTLTHRDIAQWVRNQIGNTLPVPNDILTKAKAVVKVRNYKTDVSMHFDYTAL